MSRKKVLINSIVLSVTGFFERGALFLLLPIYLTHLSTTDYGILGVLNSLSLFISVFFTLSLQSTVVRFYYDNPDDDSFHKDLYGTILTFVLILSFLSLFVFIFLGNIFFEKFVKNIPIFPYYYVALIGVATRPLFEIYQGILIAQQNAYRYAIQHTIKFIILVSITIYLIVFLELNALGALLALAITEVIFFFFTISFIFRKYKLSIKKEILIDCLKYSFPLIPNRWTGFIPRFIDKLFINNLISTSTAGVYSLGTQIGSVVRITTEGFTKAYSPWFYANVKESAKESISKVISFSEKTVLIFSYGAAMISLIIEEIFKNFVPREFSAGWVIFHFVAFQAVFNLIKGYWMMPLKYEKSKVKLTPISTYFFAISTVVLCYILIINFGIIGAAIGPMLARLLSTFLMLFLSRFGYKIKFNVGKIYFFSLGFFLVGLGSFLKIPNILVIKLIIIIVSSVAVWIYTKNDIKRLINEIIYKKD